MVNVFLKWAYGSDDTLAGSLSMLRYITCLLNSEDPRDQVYGLTIIPDSRIY